MSVAYSSSNSWGPYNPNCAATLAAGTPDPTALTVARTEPQSPSGTVNGNTGRTQMATQAALAAQHVNRA